MTKTGEVMFEEEAAIDKMPCVGIDAAQTRGVRESIMARVIALESAIRNELQILETSSSCTAQKVAGRLRAALDGKAGGGA